MEVKGKDAWKRAAHGNVALAVAHVETPRPRQRASSRRLPSSDGLEATGTSPDNSGAEHRSDSGRLHSLTPA